MARARNPNRDKAFHIWKEHGGNITNRKIAQILGEDEKKIATWKGRDNWLCDSNVVQQKPDVVQRTNVVQQPPTESDLNLEKKIITSVESNDALTDKQRAFCLHYAKTFNAFASAIKAGYSGGESARYAYQLLSKPYIQAEIKRLKELRNLSMLANADDVVEMHMRIAFADIGDFVTFDNVEVPVMVEGLPLIVDGEVVTTQKNVVRFKTSAETDTQLLAEIKEGRDGASVKLSDRHKSLEFLAKYFELNPMDRHKKAYDEARLSIEREKLNGNGNDTVEDLTPIAQMLKQDGT